MLGGGATAKRLEGLGPVRPEGTAGGEAGGLGRAGSYSLRPGSAGVRGYAGGSGKSPEGSKLQSTVT